MTEELATRMDAATLEQVLIGGDLSKLTPPQRVQYYKSVCESIGLNPLTKPFEYIMLNGKLTLYARKDCADQLRKINAVSIDDIDLQDVGDTFVVKVKGHVAGRSDVEIGVVKKTDMQGNAANAQMKAVTKAKRRLTLSLCGLGWLDETEVETIPSAHPTAVDQETGEILDGEVKSDISPEDHAQSLQGVKKAAPLAPRPPATTPAPQAPAGQPAKLTRPLAPEDLKRGFTTRAAALDMDKATCTETDRKVVASAIDAIFDGSQTMRYEVCGWLTDGVPSTKKMSAGQIKALMGILGVKSFNEAPCPESTQELKRAHTEALRAAGQMPLVDPAPQIDGGEEDLPF